MVLKVIVVLLSITSYSSLVTMELSYIQNSNIDISRIDNPTSIMMAEWIKKEVTKKMVEVEREENRTEFIKKHVDLILSCHCHLSPFGNFLYEERFTDLLQLLQNQCIYSSLELARKYGISKTSLKILKNLDDLMKQWPVAYYNKFYMDTANIMKQRIRSHKSRKIKPEGILMQLKFSVMQ